jgi:hypothetical protein
VGVLCAGVRCRHGVWARSLRAARVVFEAGAPVLSAGMGVVLLGVASVVVALFLRRALRLCCR